MKLLAAGVGPGASCLPAQVQIQEVIRTINQMQTDGVIERYAVGGAVGATFYLDPVAALDVSIFINSKAEVGKLTAGPQPIFDYLKAHGGKVEGEYVVIFGAEKLALLDVLRDRQLAIRGRGALSRSPPDKTRR